MIETALMREEDFQDRRWEYYDSQEQYEEAIEARFLRSHIPSPEEILQQTRAIRWLREHGFSDSFVKRVILHQHPRIDVVRRLVEKRGMNAQQVYMLLKELL